LVTTLQTSETGSVRGLIKVVRQFTSKNHNISLIICFRRGIYYKLEVKAPDNDGKDRLLTVTEIDNYMAFSISSPVSLDVYQTLG
jgi:hypothetical protein